jgi:hypothetical protein
MPYWKPNLDEENRLYREISEGVSKHGLTRFFEKGLNMPEVAAISGHRDARMLMRYTHP